MKKNTPLSLAASLAASLASAKPAKRRRQQDPLARHRRWLEKARAVAILPVSQGGSPHPTVRVGAVIVNARGKMVAAASNRFARGVDRRRADRCQNESRSLWINCAEQLAMMEAARKGAPLKGASLYLTLEPCTICAGLIAESGIAEVFVPLDALRHYDKLKDKWKPSIEAGRIKLAEAGVRFTTIDMAHGPEK